MLADDAHVRDLNKSFRYKDKATNVLSFPDGEETPDGGIYLGDIALAYETIAREAADQNKAIESHIAHLIIHGILHLLGHDHKDENEAHIMESLETAIMARCGYDDPYLEPTN